MRGRLVQFTLLMSLTIIISAFGCSTQGPPPQLVPTGPTMTANEKEDQKQRGDLARLFIYGLKENNRNTLLGTVVPEAIPTIDQWLHDHTPVLCRPEVIDESLGMVSRAFDSQIWTGSLSYDAPCSDKVLRKISYSLTIDELIMKKVDGAWLIANWKSLNEKWE